MRVRRKLCSVKNKELQGLKARRERDSSSALNNSSVAR